jgi:probable F420-dependent oxidoreductase
VKISVEFPSVAYREGASGVSKLASAIESIGFDELDMFDHVVMGYPTETRGAPIYPPQMPILEALMTLGFIANATSTIALGTEVLVLPQRQPVLVAKQISTLDTLSGGRMRLGVGVGWQASEYESLGEDFSTRGARMDEAIRLMRACWSDEKVNFQGKYYQCDNIAMEPKPPQGADLPIWIGGTSERALRRVGELGNGWMSVGSIDAEGFKAARAKIQEYAHKCDRNPEHIQYQSMLGAPPTEAKGKAFYADLDAVAATAANLAEMEFDWLAVNATAIFQSGAKNLDQLIDALASVFQRIRSVS